MSAQVEVVLVVLGVAQRRGLGVVPCACALPTFGVLQDVQALGVGGHQAVLDAVVDHLHEVAGAGGAAVQVALLGGAGSPLAAGRAVGAASTPGASVAKIGSRRCTTLVLAADHQAVAALEAPDAAAGADVDVVDALAPRARCGAGDVVEVVRVAAVDEDVVRLEQRRELRRRVSSTTAAGTISQTARGLVELGDEVGERGRAGRRLRSRGRHRVRRSRRRRRTRARRASAAAPGCAHPAQADHAELHVLVSLQLAWRTRSDFDGDARRCGAPSRSRRTRRRRRSGAWPRARRRRSHRLAKLREHVFGVAAVGGQQVADAAVLAEREQRVLRHRVDRLRQTRARGRSTCRRVSGPWCRCSPRGVAAAGRPRRERGPAVGRRAASRYALYVRLATFDAELAPQLVRHLVGDGDVPS